MKLADEIFWAELLELDAHRKVYGLASVDTHFDAAVSAVERVTKCEGVYDAARGGLLQSARRGVTTIVRALSRSSRRPARTPEGGIRSVDPPDGGDSSHQELESAKRAAAETAQPSARLGLVGIAVSGGGIRSATFNLGVIQAFGENGLLERADYLSTVSGGGYVGSCVTSVLGDGGSPAGFPLRQSRTGDESPAVKHLRNSIDYLAPGGFLDRIRIPALLLRGVLINMLIVLPYVLLAVVATEVLWGPSLRRGGTANYYRETLFVGALLIAWILVFPLVRRLRALGWEWRDKLELSFAAALAIFVVTAAINTLPLAIWWFSQSRMDSLLPRGLHAGSWLAIASSMIPFLFVGKASAALGTWRGKLAMYALGLLAPCLLLLLYFQLASARVFLADRILFPSALWTWATGATLPLAPGLSSWSDGQRLDLGLLALAGVLLVVAWVTVDVNLTSLHGFYRDRLSKAYLFRVRDGRIAPHDELRLSDLNPSHRAPYQLLNATVNLQGSRNPERRGRNADFFLFSKHYCGSDRTGFCRTTDLERSDRRLDLATAMAISGAALSGNMGVKPLRSLVLIMTLLNVRTGYWLPNPRIAPRPVYERGPLTGVRPLFLLREFFGLLNEKSRYVNVSDGGHLENLGLYELLKRRCRFIIICDAECDANMAFGGLATVVRYARIDLGADVQIALDGIRGEPAGRRKLYCAVGQIRYPGGEIGRVLYVKACLTGDESVDITEYHARNPHFPHESTGRQFFDEAQFEAYRQLGHHIGSVLLSGPLVGRRTEKVLSDWFDSLEAPAETTER